MKMMIKLLGTVLFLGLVFVGHAYSGLYDVSANSRHSLIANWYFSTVARASISKRAASVDVPSLDDEALVMAGINDYDSMCVACHGAPGKSPDSLGQGLNPPAPNLAQSAQKMTPAELFWVTKHGVKMTGMPAWGATHDDDSLWPMVAFMVKLPELDGPAYQEKLNLAVGRGHHDGGAPTAEHEHAETEVLPGKEVHIHDDGSEHDHEVPREPDTTIKHDYGAHSHDDG